jgi:hypothetical protein
VKRVMEEFKREFDSKIEKIEPKIGSTQDFYRYEKRFSQIEESIDALLK